MEKSVIMGNVKIKTYLNIVFCISAMLMGCASIGQNVKTDNGGSSLTGMKNPHKVIQSFSGDNEVNSLSIEENLVNNDSEKMGDSYYRQGLYYKAYSEYQKALEADPRNKDILFKKGLTLFSGRQYENAIKAFKEVLNIDANHALSCLMIGQAYFQMEDYDLAERYLKQSVSLDVTIWKAYNLMGVIHDYRKEYKEAIEDYILSIVQSPDNGLIYHNLGLAYYMNGEYEKAVRSYNQAIASKYNTEKTYNNLALALAKTGKFNEALDAFMIGGDKASAYNNMGCIFMGHGDYQEAIAYFEKAIEASPTFYIIANENMRKAKIMVEQFKDSREQGVE